MQSSLRCIKHEQCLCPSVYLCELGFHILQIWQSSKLSLISINLPTAFFFNVELSHIVSNFASLKKLKSPAKTALFS